MIEQADGRATVVVGTHIHWWREQTIDFARYVRKLGADGVMVVRSDALPGDTPGIEDTIFETYQAIAKSVDCGIVLQGLIFMKLLKRLVEIPNVVALKEDAGDSWCHDALWAVGKKISVFNGGQKWRFLYGLLCGMTGYLSTYGLFAPQVTHQFWDAVERKDLFAAAHIVDTYDNPYFVDYAIEHPKGFPAVRQAALEIFGRGPHWIRPPQAFFNNQEMDELRAVFSKMNLL